MRGERGAMGGPLKDILREVYPLHRTLASDGTDAALEIIGRYLPDDANYTIETYAPGQPVWTWKVPERYVVHSAYLETEDGERVVDFADNPLHLVSYSLPVEKLLTWEELEPHLHYSDKRPQAIPWEFKYYERSWGFCLSKDRFDHLRRDVRYRAVIRSEFVTDADRGFRVGVARIDPEGGLEPQAGECIIAAHVCHPMQANDDVAGVVTAIGVAQRLAARRLPRGSMSVRMLFCPETIGSIAYLAHHEDLIPALRGGVFLDMTGNRNRLVLQRSRQDDHLLDRVARHVLRQRGDEFEEGEFAQVAANDERVINGPGVNVPCISFSRWPYPEYHTTDDSPDIIHEEMLQDAAEVTEQVVRIYASNYVPRRNFRGPVFLSGHGLWVDWRVNWALNRAIEKIMMRFEGEHSIFAIADELGLDYWETRDYVERFRAQGLVQAEPIPSEAMRA
jgi:aminopeptidase-like protein